MPSSGGIQDQEHNQNGSLKCLRNSNISRQQCGKCIGPYNCNGSGLPVSGAGKYPRTHNLCERRPGAPRGVLRKQRLLCTAYFLQNLWTNSKPWALEQLSTLASGQAEEESTFESSTGAHGRSEKRGEFYKSLRRDLRVYRWCESLLASTGRIYEPWDQGDWRRRRALKRFDSSGPSLHSALLRECLLCKCLVSSHPSSSASAAGSSCPEMSCPALR